MKCKGCGARLGKVPGIQILDASGAVVFCVLVQDWGAIRYEHPYSEKDAACLDCTKKALDAAIVKRDKERERRKKP